MATEVIKTMFSIYEVDYEGRRVRRIKGVTAPTPYHGPDGGWQPFLRLIDWGSRLEIHWDERRSTTTSTILSRITP